MGIRNELHRNLDTALGDDPRLALAAVRRLIDDELPWLERRTVLLARQRGYSWGRIARLLQRSRLAVHRRFVGDEATWAAPPPRLLDPADVLDRTMIEARRVGALQREIDRLEDNGDVVPW